MDDLKKLGRQVRRMGRGRGRRYSAAMKRRILVAVDEARADGTIWPEVVAAVDVPMQTLRRWQQEREGELEPAELVPVALVDAGASPSQEALTGVTPGGYRVEGLDVDGAVALVRQLR